MGKAESWLQLHKYLHISKLCKWIFAGAVTACKPHYCLQSIAPNIFLPGSTQAANGARSQPLEPMSLCHHNISISVVLLVPSAPGQRCRLCRRHGSTQESIFLNTCRCFLFASSYLEKFKGFPKFQGYLISEPGQKWRGIHTFITTRHLYTMFLAPIVCINGFFKCLAHAAEQDNGIQGKRETIRYTLQKSWPHHLPSKCMQCFPGLLHWYVCELSIIYVLSQ